MTRIRIANVRLSENTTAHYRRMRSHIRHAVDALVSGDATLFNQNASAAWREQVWLEATLHWQRECSKLRL